MHETQTLRDTGHISDSVEEHSGGRLTLKKTREETAYIRFHVLWYVHLFNC